MPRADFLQHNLHHLHKSRNHEDEGNGLQELKSERHQQVLVEKEGDYGRKGHHEAYRSAHTHCCAELVGNTQERTDAEELGKQDIVDKDCRNDNHQIFHNISSLLLEILVEQNHKVAQYHKGTRSHHESENTVARDELPAENRAASQNLADNADNRERKGET